ncbi:MAG: efflux RND transporter periplasmic adaptor subunit [Paracoccaceae bacterium]
MRVVPILFSAAALIGLGAYFLGGPDETATGPAAVAATPEPTGPRPVPVAVLESRAAETRAVLTARGRTAADRRVDVEAETTGRMISPPIRRGARVTSGQVLCRLDPGSRPAQLSEARARLAEAEAEARAAETLSSKGFTAETTRVARQAALEAARAAVELIELDIDRLEIVAPFDGLLESDTAELGKRLGEGDLCATVIDLDRIRVSGFVAEGAVDRIAPGQPADIRLVNGRSVAGEVSFVARVADPETRTYEIEALVPNPDGQIRDGMTAELRLSLPPETAHLLPQSALTLDDGGRLGVRLVERTADTPRARFVPVAILRDDPRGVWVSGLPETAEVIVVGQEFVRGGGAIRPTRVAPGDLG